MKRYLKYILTLVLSAVILFEALVLGLLCFPKDVFSDSFQSLIVDKYRILQETNEPKIIVVSGSSSSFGLDQKMLEEATGYKVANMGLHAGFGHLFYSELAKENINPGDIVLLAYEYTWQNGFDFLGQDLIMSGIDNNIDMYKHIPVKYWKSFVGCLLKHAQTKNSYAGAKDIYSRQAFDSETGQMTMHREYVMDYANNSEAYGKLDLTDAAISPGSVEYLRDYREYVESKGASIYFVAPPVLKAAVACDYAEFERLIQLEESEIGIEYISNPEDYFFEEEMMSNSIYHCSTEGEKLRTQLLIDDLKRAGVIG